jgi:hypothetical protein
LGSNTDSTLVEDLDGNLGRMSLAYRGSTIPNVAHLVSLADLTNDVLLGDLDIVE